MTADAYLDLHNELHFPALNDLPTGSQMLDRPYFRSDDGSFAIHWCFLAEIKCRIPWPIRPMYKVVDRHGVECLVSFNLDDRSQFPRIQQECKDGYTMCIMYAFYHSFLDGQQGIRVEVENTVKVVPCGLQKLLELGDRLKNAGRCAVCDKDAKLKCSRCRLCYCSKDCQVKDWGNGHKKECKAAQQVLEWGRFDWNQFDRFRVFGA